MIKFYIFQSAALSYNGSRKKHCLRVWKKILKVVGLCLCNFFFTIKSLIEQSSIRLPYLFTAHISQYFT